MVTERDVDIYSGNVFSQYNRDEFKIGIIGSCLRKRDTLYMGLIGIWTALKDIEAREGSLPEVTIGLTHKKMADFAQRRLGMAVKPVPREGARGFVYQVSGNTHDVKAQITRMITDRRRNNRLRRKALV